VDGYDLTPALAESITRATESVTQQTNPFGTASEAHTPVGMVKASLAVGNGIFDEAVDPLHHAKISNGGVGVSRLVCLCDRGQTLGLGFTGYGGAYSQKSEVLGVLDALTKANVAYQVSGAVDEGEILQPLVAKTADWDTKSTPVDAADLTTAKRVTIVSSSVNATSTITTLDHHGFASGDVVAIFNHTSVTPDINDNPTAAESWKLIGHTITVTGEHTFTIPVNVSDGGVDGYCVLVSRAGGGVGHLQITAGSGFTNFVGKVVHSVDGSTWADLITFADTTTNYHAAQRVATALTTTVVRRYLAFDGNVTGSGSLTVFGGFARG
jgi:hypothetical protein